MKSLKKWSVTLSAVVIASTLLVGCGAKADEAKKPAKELTIQEVMTKTNEVSKKATGIIVDIKGKQKMGMPGMSMEQDINFKEEITLNPNAIHLTGSMKMMGQDINMEMYMLDKESYMKMSGMPGAEGWMKAPKGMSLKELGLDQFTDKSKQSLDQFNKALAAYEKDPGAMTLKKENGTYVVTFDSSKVKDQTKLGEIYKSAMDQMMKNAQLDPTAKADMDKIMKDLKISEVKQTVTIDEKTFEVKKMDISQKVSMKIEKQEMSIDQNFTMDFKGAPTSPITVPEDVKKTAKETKM